MNSIRIHSQQYYLVREAKEVENRREKEREIYLQGTSFSTALHSFVSVNQRKDCVAYTIPTEIAKSQSCLASFSIPDFTH